MNVNVNTTTRDQTFPPGTMDAPFMCELVDQTPPAAADGSMPPVAPIANLMQKSVSGMFVFTDVPRGRFIARVSKLGVSAVSEVFQVGDGNASVTIQVPESVTVDMPTTTPPAP